MLLTAHKDIYDPKTNQHRARPCPEIVGKIMRRALEELSNEALLEPEQGRTVHLFEKGLGIGEGRRRLHPEAL